MCTQSLMFGECNIREHFVFTKYEIIKFVVSLILLAWLYQEYVYSYIYSEELKYLRF